MSSTKAVRTAIGSIIQTGMYTKKPIPNYPNSTLNQKLDIQPNLTLAVDEQPGVRYLAIGNGGHDFVVAGNKVLWKDVLHTPKHAALYNQLPFVLRKPAEDLSPAERAKYRLRRLETHGGQQYAAYYLRVLDYSDTELALELRHVEDGVTTSSAYQPTLEDLNPVPPVINTGAQVTAIKDYVASTAKVPFVMTPEDVEEFLSAVEIIDGDLGAAIISEIATVAGVDRSVSGNFNGQQVNYTEVVRAQVSAFVTSGFIMSHQTDGIDILLDVGNVEPLFDLT